MGHRIGIPSGVIQEIYPEIKVSLIRPPSSRRVWKTYKGDVPMSPKIIPNAISMPPADSFFILASITTDPNRLGQLLSAL